MDATQVELSRLNGIYTKWCAVCKTYGTAHEFIYDDSTWDGLKDKCIDCCKFNTNVRFPVKMSHAQRVNYWKKRILRLFEEEYSLTPVQLADKAGFARESLYPSKKVVLRDGSCVNTYAFTAVQELLKENKIIPKNINTQKIYYQLNTES